MPRPICIPTDSDEEAMENPPPVPNNADIVAADKARNTVNPTTQTYHCRTRASLIAPPPSSPLVARDTQGGKTPQEDTPSTSHGQKRPRTPSPPPSPSPERQPETPIVPPPAIHEEGELPSDLPKPTHLDHITQTLTFNKASEWARLDRVSSLPYHPGPLTPRHERVFIKKKAQPAPTDGIARDTEQAPQVDEPPPVAPQQEANQASEDVVPN
ncbi:cell surface glycoprotein 1-like [Manihot esculenta]|uniref:cell surface glycoprotein 1-like n=1 Tax=Manihot esculenta TaxID=3983 RepID=UPI000B5D824C|nr:cell surface glycoprotein 1-like [Manihot esculenta]